MSRSPASRGSRLAEHAYGIALRAYPPEFRQALGASMREAFADQCRDARCRGGRLRLAVITARALVDAVRNGLAERLRPASRGGRRPDTAAAAGAAPGSRSVQGLAGAGGQLGTTQSSRLPTGGGLRRLATELRGTSRRLARSPAFSLLVVAAVGLGVGAFASILGVVDGVLLEPLPYEEPEELVYLWRNYEWMSFPRGWMGGVDVLALREQSTLLEGVTALRSGRFNLSGRDGGEPQEVRVILATAELFDLLGVQPALGRSFAPGEDAVDARPVVVLGHRLWRQRYGGDPDIVGRDIYMDGDPTQVVGVAPEWFDFALHSSLGSPTTADAYATLQMELAGRTGGEMAALARLGDGATPEQLQAELDAIVEPIDRLEFGARGLSWWVVGLQEDLTGGVLPVLAAVIAAAAFVLLILCVNLATLLLGRGAARERDLAVRAALGAGRGELAREMVLEGALLGLVGGVLGLLLAFWGTPALLAILPEDLPRRGAVELDRSVALVAAAAAVLLGALAGLVPALRAARTDLGAALREASLRAEGGGSRARSGLVVAQVALSLMLLAGAGVLARSFAYLLAADPGFDPRGVLSLRVPLSDQQYPEPADATAFFRRLRHEIEALPGVIAAGASNALPLTQETNQTRASFPGAPGNGADPQQNNPLVDWFTVTPGYFEALRVRLVAGRGFADSDDAAAPPVAIIDDTLARRFFPSDDPIGQPIDFFAETRTIVGVVDQPRLYQVHADDRGQVFLPVAQRPRGALSFAVRAEREPLALAGEIRRVAGELDPDQPIAEVRTMQEIVAASLADARLGVGLIGGFSLAALLLASLGLYGVVAHGVVRRTHEIGVRMALGADPGRVRAMVVGRGLLLAAAGIGLGLLGALGATRLLEGLLVGVEPADPITFAVVSATLALVALLAAWLPARRATRIDPREALRAD